MLTQFHIEEAKSITTHDDAIAFTIATLRVATQHVNTQNHTAAQNMEVLNHAADLLEFFTVVKVCRQAPIFTPSIEREDA